MARQRHLNRAPILEAILNIRVVPQPGTKFESLQPLVAAFAPRYEKTGEKRSPGLRIKFDAKTGAAAVSSESGPQGLVFASQVASFRIQVSSTDFTQNVLRPYPDFETLIAEARANWRIYAQHMKPLSISKVGLRYVNQLHVPVSAPAIETYLPVIPSLPEDVELGVTDFLYRMTVSDPRCGAKAVVNQIFQGESEGERAIVILDIDTLLERQVEPDDENLWSLFDDLRRYKNDLFFNFVTEKLLEAYE